MSEEPQERESEEVAAVAPAQPPAGILAEVIQSIFEPGVNRGLFLALCISFVLLILVLGTMVIITEGNLHVVFLTFIAVALFGTTLWYVSPQLCAVTQAIVARNTQRPSGASWSRWSQRCNKDDDSKFRPRARTEWQAITGFCTPRRVKRLNRHESRVMHACASRQAWDGCDGVAHAMELPPRQQTNLSIRVFLLTFLLVLPLSIRQNRFISELNNWKAEEAQKEALKDAQASEAEETTEGESKKEK
jgi:hypothetical protein